MSNKRPGHLSGLKISGNPCLPVILGGYQTFVLDSPVVYHLHSEKHFYGDFIVLELQKSLQLAFIKN